MSLLHPLFQENHRIHHHILSALLLSLVGVHSFLGVNHMLAQSQENITSSPTSLSPEDNGTQALNATFQDSSRFQVFASRKSTLYVTKSGYGRVESVDTSGNTIEGISCGRDCSQKYPRDTRVTLKATPANGYVFSGWRSACSAKDTSCTISLTTQRKIAIAVFKKDPSLTPLPSTNTGSTNTSSGSSTSSGITSGGIGSGITTLPIPVPSPDAPSSPDGVCGMMHGATLSTVPQLDLCKSGTASEVIVTDVYLWSCKGLSSGIVANCSAKKTSTNSPLPTPNIPTTPIVEVICGTANGMTFATIPTFNLCKSGTPSSVSGSGPWTWTCRGSGDRVLTCRAAKTASTPIPAPTINKLPVATINTPTPNTPSISVILGTAVNFAGSSVDPDGTIAAHEWRDGSCATGTLLSTVSSWTKSDFSLGTHTIYFRSKDNTGAWSTNCQSRVVQVTSAPISMCSYPAPPAGCDYMQGPNYNEQTNCGMTLSCTSSPSTPQNSYLLTTVSTNGTLVSSPGGIDCGRLCSAEYTPNTRVTLTATPASGYVFSSWSGCTSGISNTTCTVTLDQSRTVRANFTQIVTTPIATTGACGTSHNTTVSSIPTTNLCRLGTASSVVSSDLYSWTCGGINGGASVSCRANQSIVLIPSTTIPNGAGVAAPIPNTYNPGWTFCSPLYTGGCEFSGFRTIRYGNGTRWAYKDYLNGFPGWHCNPTTFGVTSGQEGDHCEVAETIKTGTLAVPVTPQHGGMYPTINLAAIPLGPDGSNVLKIEPTTDFGAVGSDIGAFRIPCTYAKMAFNDPIVYPGQPGRSHLHTFFGNTAVDAYSTQNSIATTGNSTCAGGIANRSSYWVPSIIDTTTGTPIAPIGSLWYYKTAYGGVRPADVQVVPAGLRVIAGSMYATGAQTGIHWECHNTSGVRGSTIPTNCPVGDTVAMSIGFPQCWDGVNLDSPNHQSHMAYPTGNGCPSTHPVPLPELSLHIQYKVNTFGEARNWRLSSDHEGNAAGLSLHADFFEGWNRNVMNTFVTNCLNPSKDCHAYLLGNGTSLVD